MMNNKQQQERNKASTNVRNDVTLQWKADFLSFLKNREPMVICFHKQVEIPALQPKIYIEGLEDDQLAFPITKHQIRSITKEGGLAEKATLFVNGKRQVDETYRKGWEVQASKISFLGRAWDDVLSSIVSEVKRGLKIKPWFNIKAHLYKMVLYEVGGFCNVHHHVSKEEGMFGAMTLQLPSKYEGGKHVVKFNKEKITMDHSRMSADGFYVAASYCHCSCQVQPITAGTKVELLYNLIAEPCNNRQQQQQTSRTTAATTTPDQLVLPDLDAMRNETLQSLKLLVRKWDQASPLHSFQGIVLEKRFNKKENMPMHIGLDGFTGRDKAIVDLLLEVKNESNRPLLVVTLLVFAKRNIENENGDKTITRTWIGSDGKELARFDPPFDFEHHLLGKYSNANDLFCNDDNNNDNDTVSCRVAVMFWPKEKNITVIREAGLPFFTTFLYHSCTKQDLSFATLVFDLADNNKGFSGTGNNSTDDKNKNAALLGFLMTRSVPNLAAHLNYGIASACTMSTATSIILAKLVVEMGRSIRQALLHLVKRSPTTRTASGQWTALPYSPILVCAFAKLLKRQGSRDEELIHDICEAIVTASMENKSAYANKDTGCAVGQLAFESSSHHPALFGKFVTGFLAHLQTNKRPLPHFENLLQSLAKIPEMSNNADYLRLQSYHDTSRATTAEQQQQQQTQETTWTWQNVSYKGRKANEVKSFLGSNEREGYIRGFKNIADARDFALYLRHYLNGIVSGSAMGQGNDAYVKIVKTPAENKRTSIVTPDSCSSKSGPTTTTTTTQSSPATPITRRRLRSDTAQSNLVKRTRNNR